MNPKVAIIGKSNTGKSTLFNRIAGFRKAIVLSEFGITRDRNFSDIKWGNKTFTLVDTGGLDYLTKKESIQRKISEQVRIAILESEVIIFLLDFMTGIQQEDIDISKMIKKNNKKTILVINKCDIKNKNFVVSDFFNLGLGEPFPISAEQGINIYDLLEKICEFVPDTNNRDVLIDEFEDIVKITIIGKPNVGKSSILNAILKEERIIVDETPGTTRDAIEASIDFNGYRFDFIDTAGLRRKKEVKDIVEYFGNLRSLKSIEKADIVLLVLDATHVISMQDKRLARKIVDEKKACIVLLNKYDLVKKNIGIDKNYLLKISKKELSFLKDAPILTSVAIDPKKDFLPILNKIIEVFKKYNKKISTSELNNLLQNIVNSRPPKLIDRKKARFYYITQIGVKPPSFKIFVNNPELIYNSYQRYIENQFINQFDLKGIPIDFIFEKRK